MPVLTGFYPWIIVFTLDDRAHIINTLMAANKTNPYNIDRHIAELYDRIKTGMDDLDLIRKMIGVHTSPQVLEPFCGTGRLLIPLSEDGHIVHGLDQSQAMLDIAGQKRMSYQAGGRMDLTW